MKDVISVSIEAVLAFFAWVFVWSIFENNPQLSIEPTKTPTYTTEDGKHQHCTLSYYAGIFKPDSWSLECPDGFVQHLGNYVKE